MLTRQGQIICALGTHVDDLIIVANDAGCTAIRKLEEVFPIKEWNYREVVYCGRRLIQHADFSISVSMADYVETLPLLQVPDHRQRTPEEPCTPAETRERRGLLGALGWLSTMGRPDISFPVSKLQGFVSDSQVLHLLEANQVVREARKYKDVRLLYRPLDLNSITFAAISDASFATMNNGRSQTGVVVLIGDGVFDSGQLGTVNFVAWRSGRQKRVARSTFGSECLALGDAVDLADFCRGLWAEMLGVPDPRTSLESKPSLNWVTDSKDLHDNLAREGAPNCAEKRLALDLFVMRELAQRPRNHLLWIDTAHTLADSLTKSMVNTFLRHCLLEGKYSYTYDPSCRNVRKVAKGAVKLKNADNPPSRTSRPAGVSSKQSAQRSGSGSNPDASFNGPRPKKKSKAARLLNWQAPAAAPAWSLDLDASQPSLARTRRALNEQRANHAFVFGFCLLWSRLTCAVLLAVSPQKHLVAKHGSLASR